MGNAPEVIALVPWPQLAAFIISLILAHLEFTKCVNLFIKTSQLVLQIDYVLT
jgi:hypothetical protein